MTFCEIRNKEVINICSGCKIGYVCDCEIEVQSGRIETLIVPGKLKCFGLLGREDDYVIPWDKISIIGNDLIMVDFEVPRKRRKKEKHRFYR